jgi:hypothetical protein
MRTKVRAPRIGKKTAAILLAATLGDYKQFIHATTDELSYKRFQKLPVTISSLYVHPFQPTILL